MTVSPDRRQRLVYVHQYFLTPSMSGGVRSYEFASRLAKAGYDVHVVATDRYNSFRGWRVESVNGFTVHWVSVRYDNTLGFLSRIAAFLTFSLLSVFKVFTLKADLNIATSTPLTVAIPVLVCKMLRGVPFVFEVRDLWPEVPIKLGYLKNPLLVAGARWLEKQAYVRARAVIALSPDMVKGVVARGIPPDKVHFIPNASDTQVLRHADPVAVDQFWSARGINLQQSRLVLYTGTMGRVNKAGWLVDVAQAAMLLPDAADIVFVIMGDGAERAAIIRQAEAGGVLGRNFFVLDPVGKSELALALAAARLSLSLVDNEPVLWGNSANKFFDAFAAGIPVGINHGGWQAELIRSSACGLVLERDAGIAARQILAFLQDGNAQTEARSRSAALGDGVFSRETLYADFSAVIKVALESG